RFLAALQRHSPNAALFVLAVIKELAVWRFDRGDSTVLCSFGWRTALNGHFPNVERFRTSLRGKVEPLSITGPAGGEIVSARNGLHEMRESSGNFDNVNFAALLGMKFECDVTPIRSP